MDNSNNIYYGEYSKESTGATIIYHALVMAGLFSLIFIIAKILGLEKVIWLRYINYLIFFPVAYASLKKKYHTTEKLNYFSGLMTGFLTCFFGQIIYTLLFFVYLHFDKSLVNHISSIMPNGIIYPELSISFMLFSEGLAWSLITSFSLMQIFKWKRGNWAVHS